MRLAKLQKLMQNLRALAEKPSTVPLPDFRAYLLGGPKVDSFEVPRDRVCGRDIGL
jgi:hypothetical protein